MGSSVGSDMRYGGGEALVIQNGAIYYTETRYGDAVLLRKTGDAEPELLVEGPGSVDAITVAPDGRVAFTGFEPNGLSGLYLVMPAAMSSRLRAPTKNSCAAGMFLPQRN